MSVHGPLTIDPRRASSQHPKKRFGMHENKSGENRRFFLTLNVDGYAAPAVLLLFSKRLRSFGSR